MSDERFELEKIPPPTEAPLERGGYPRTAGYPMGYPSAGAYEETTADGENINLRELWRTVYKRKWLIINLALIVTLLVTVEAFRSKNIYQATTTIEIGKDRVTLMKMGDLLVQADDSDSIKTMMLYVTSRPLLEDLVVKLNLDREPRFLDVYQVKTRWEVLSELIGDFWSDSASAAKQAKKENLLAEPRPEGATGERTAAERDRLSPFVGILKGNLGISQIDGTRALSISFTHTDPEIAALVANGAARDFIERSFQNKTERFTNTSAWLKKTTEDLKNRVQESEQKLASYSRDNNIFNMESGESLTTSKLASLYDQVTRAETERKLKESLYEEVQQGRISQIPEAFSDPAAKVLQEKLGELATQEAQLSVKFGPDNPEMVKIRQQREILQLQLAESREELKERLKADYERSAKQVESLKAALELAKLDAVNENHAGINYSLLRQDVETTKALYVDFLKKTNQADLEVAEQHNNLRVIEDAQVPGWPVGPQRMRSIFIALFLSLAAGIGLAFLLDYLDNTIKTEADVMRYTQLATLSVIPAIGDGGGRFLPGGRRNKQKLLKDGTNDSTALVPGASQLTTLDKQSIAAEAYRVLRTSLLLSSAGNPPKTILVTSGQPGEGKSTTVINTGIVLAQLGASVLIIDCDLRRPSTHKVLGISNENGVSKYLSRDVEIDDLIHKTAIPNLFLLPCGRIPPNPAELLSSNKMKELLKLLSERYDHILIDSPPLINVTDPIILSRLVDGVVLVVHGGKSTNHVVRRARQELSNVGAKVFGVVLNNLDMRQAGSDDYYAYRYYNYYSNGTGQDA